MASTTFGGSDRGYDMSLWYDSRPLKIGWFTMLAVVGAEVRLHSLRRVLVHASGDAESVAPALDEAVRARVLVAPPDQLLPYRFVHDLFREVQRRTKANRVLA